jgi:DNA-binding transcriptional LysR family regulator
MADKLTEMQAFRHAAETGSFAAAAARLGVSAQMVGKHVAAVEQRLGTLLLNRSTRHQSLTEAGRLYLDGCRRALAEVDAAEACVTAHADAPRGMLRVTAPVAFGAGRLVPDSTEFLARYPEVRLHFELTDRRVNLVEEGFDAAIRVGDQPNSSLVSRKLAPYQLVPCASPGYVTRYGLPLHPDELRGHECLDYVFPAHPAPSLWYFQSMDATIVVEPTGRLFTNDSRALIEAALRGYGIVLVADLLVAEHLAAGRLLPLLAGWTGPSRPMFLLAAARRARAAKLRAFLDWVVETFAPSPGRPPVISLEQTWN